MKYTDGYAAEVCAGTTAAAILTLTLSMAATTAMFSTVEAVALAARYLARRAARVDPIVALREQSVRTFVGTVIEQKRRPLTDSRREAFRKSTQRLLLNANGARAGSIGRKQRSGSKEAVVIQVPIHATRDLGSLGPEGRASALQENDNHDASCRRVCVGGEPTEAGAGS
jgi:hypothetical protein